MGIYDRDYFQEDRRSWIEGGARTMVVNLIIINVIVYIAEVFFQNLRLVDLLGVQADVWREPWNLWKLLTYGFTHDLRNIFHILLNMYALWLFGQELEATFGKKEFLAFYLSTIVLAGIGWVAAQNLLFGGGNPVLVGASGGVMGVAVVFAMRHPHHTIYVWFLPVPVWLFVGFLVLKDFSSLANAQGGGIAYEAHLAGAFAGFLYQKYQWHLGSWLSLATSRRSKRGEFPRVLKMRVHRESGTSAREDLESQVDRLLDKIQREGEANLTPAERATLEEASRKYRNRRGARN
ncbi:MAG: rhomboid family intramembrane serine protease [Gemmataceae bacterium]|nr:rhomboid family intramembrane serine protease [Gemmataceae bacterium]